MRIRLLALSLVLAFVMMAVAASAAERATQGTPNIQHHATPNTNNVPSGGLGTNLPKQNVPQNSLSDSAAEQQKKLEEAQRIAKCRKECDKQALYYANYLFPMCPNGKCTPGSQTQKKWTEKYDMVNKGCRAQMHCQ